MKCSSEASSLGSAIVAGEASARDPHCCSGGSAGVANGYEAGASRCSDSTTSTTSTVDLQKLACDLRVYAVTDRSWLGLAENATEAEKKAALCQQVRAALDGGTTFVQMREKHLDHTDMIAEATALQKICHTAGVPFVVNDAVNVALAMNADGIHIGQDDMSAHEARALVGPDKILGVSAQTVEQALQAERDGADYLGVGAVFPTSSKDDAVEVSHETLTAICNAVNIPVVAIGGITCENVSELAASGIVGVAVISAIFAHKDIAAAAAHLAKATSQLVGATA